MLVGAVGQLRRGVVEAGGPVVYLGGAFNGDSSVRASTRNRAAAVDASVDANTDAMVRAWNPDCNNVIIAMVLNGPDMYLGGGFTTVRGATRNRAACVDSDSSQANPTLRAWNPDCANSVQALILNGSDMYLGGQFTTVGGFIRNRAACVDSDPTQATPALRAWNPDCSSTVRSMVLNGPDMYLGGGFSTISGASRSRGACVASDPATNILRPWNPECNNNIWVMVLNGSDMYLGGDFTMVRGQSRPHAACVDSDPSQETPALRSWDPGCNGTVRSMILNGPDMYLGGNFLSVGGSARSRAACIDSTPSQMIITVRSWNPNCDSVVDRMTLNDSDMYIVGQFGTVRGAARSRAACVDSDASQANPALRAWNPNLNNHVYMLVLSV